MEKNKLYKLLTEFLESGEFDWLHIKTEGKEGRKEFFYNKPTDEAKDEAQPEEVEAEVIEQEQPVQESLRERVQRIMQSETIDGAELEWWKEVQTSLGSDNQIQRDDTLEMALEKLARIGLIE